MKDRIILLILQVVSILVSFVALIFVAANKELFIEIFKQLFSAQNLGFEIDIFAIVYGIPVIFMILAIPYNKYLERKER